MGINVVPDKVVLVHSACNLVFLSSCCAFLLYTGHLYNYGRYSGFPFLLSVIVNEITKMYFAYLCGLPLAELIWRDDRLILPPNQKTSKLKDLFRCILIFITMLAVYFIVAVLFGAEILSKHEETLLFSITLCALTVFPSCVHLGPNCTINNICGMKPNDSLALSIYRNLQFTLFGAWLGAFVIPLDWDRSWQEWPTPCLFGALLGSFFFNLINVCHHTLKQRKVGRKSN